MIIVSQDKKEIVNFDNIMNINICGCKEDEYTISAGFIVGRADNYRKLGFYKTEERAKEVLQEIVDTYEKTQYYKYGFEKDKEYIYEIADNLFKYEMPEK